MKITEALEIYSLTDPGMVRSHNEDSVACLPECGLVVLADGMGGYNAGEVASGMAVSVVITEVGHALQHANPVEHDRTSGNEVGASLLYDGFLKANESILQAAENQPEYYGMGTTMVSALFYDNRVVVGHVGDSRAYRLRGETLSNITRDHSLLQEQIDGGIISIADARLSKNRNLVTRAVGIDEIVVPEIHVHQVEVGDIYILCSDGLNDMVEDETIQAKLCAFQNDLPMAASQLIQVANDNGGRDNVSVILVKIMGDYSRPKSWLAKMMARFQN